MIRTTRPVVAQAMLRAFPFALLAIAAAATGCGGSSGTATTSTAADRPAATATTPVPGPAGGSPTDDEIRHALQLPDRVPVRATGTAPADEVAVVRAWLDQLRAGHVAAAARLFGLPARFQNFTSVALMQTREQALAVTSSLPCGARMTKAGGANGFVVYEARLTERPGGACGSGVGSVVRGAVLVRGGHMLEWYRLPDRSRPRRGQPAIPDGPLV